MYNRYVPQPDGSYRRNRLPENETPPQRQTPVRNDAPGNDPPKVSQPQEPPCQQKNDPPSNRSCSFRSNSRQFHRPPQSNYVPPPKDAGVSAFLRQLLPKDFCTEDLLVVLLLLLMSGDVQEDQNTALLTLALYLFL